MLLISCLRKQRTTAVVAVSRGYRDEGGCFAPFWPSMCFRWYMYREAMVSTVCHSVVARPCAFLGDPRYMLALWERLCRA